jgi:hypothetical protein
MLARILGFVCILVIVIGGLVACGGEQAALIPEPERPTRTAPVPLVLSTPTPLPPTATPMSKPTATPMPPLTATPASTVTPAPTVTPPLPTPELKVWWVWHIETAISAPSLMVVQQGDKWATIEVTVFNPWSARDHEEYNDLEVYFDLLLSVEGLAGGLAISPSPEVLDPVRGELRWNRIMVDPSKQLSTFKVEVTGDFEVLEVLESTSILTYTWTTEEIEEDAGGEKEEKKKRPLPTPPGTSST